MADARRSGRTTRMIARLPASGSVVVVHSPSVVDVFREAVRRSRGAEVAAVTRIIAAPALVDERAATRGLEMPVFRDHFVEEQRAHRRALMQGFRL